MKTLVYFVLVLSVLFNVFFAAGYVRAQRVAAAEAAEARLLPDARQHTGEADRPERDDRGMEARMMRELDLTHEQASRWRDLHEAHRDETQQIDQRLELIHAELATVLGTAPIDEAALRDLVEQAAMLRQERHIAASQRFAVFLDDLEPAQVRRIAERMHRKHAEHTKRREEMIVRFDADGNGELDESERAAARARFGEDRDEMRERRQTMMFERLDSDADGVISRDEFAEMQWSGAGRRGRRGGSRGGPGE